jgi:hypothetical protein
MYGINKIGKMKAINQLSETKLITLVIIKKCPVKTRLIKYIHHSRIRFTTVMCIIQLKCAYAGLASISYHIVSETTCNIHVQTRKYNHQKYFKYHLTAKIMESHNIPNHIIPG